MTNLKNRLIFELIVREGRYSNRKDDAGGETKFGITKKTARRNGYGGEMKELTREQARKIYESIYWEPIKGDEISAINDDLIEELFDTAVNCGPEQAGKFLQRSLNVFNRKGALYQDIDVDGKIGPATIKALKAYAKHRDVKILVRAMNCLQGAFYIGLAEKREADEENIYGWLTNRIVV
jgi:lysozyme family protein